MLRALKCFLCCHWAGGRGRGDSELALFPKDCLGPQGSSLNPTQLAEPARLWECSEPGREEGSLGFLLELGSIRGLDEGTQGPGLSAGDWLNREEEPGRGLV